MQHWSVATRTKRQALRNIAEAFQVRDVVCVWFDVSSWRNIEMINESEHTLPCDNVNIAMENHHV